MWDAAASLFRHPLAATPRVFEQPRPPADTTADAPSCWTAVRARFAADMILDAPSDPRDGVGRQATRETIGVEAHDGGVQPQLARANQVPASRPRRADADRPPSLPNRGRPPEFGLRTPSGDLVGAVRRVQSSACSRTSVRHRSVGRAGRPPPARSSAGRLVMGSPRNTACTTYGCIEPHALIVYEFVSAQSRCSLSD